MKKDTFTDKKAEDNPTGGVLVGKRQGQTIIHNKGSLSGYLVGKTHAEGGIKAINKSTGQPLEMQGGEVVITAPAVSDQTKHDFDGEMLTNRQILSKINEKGGGVAFAQDGMEIPKDIKRTGASYNFGGKTMTDHEIYKYITGGHLAKGYSLRDIANMHKISIADLKKEVRMGLKAESEHTSSKRKQMQIVKDHLYENPKYYTLLKKAGLKDGGQLNLVSESKKGDHTSRDLNNYNDLLDVGADGQVGMDNGLAFANGGLIAPNGNTSNLTREQYKLVRTPEFKAWFGDWENDPENSSKVVDENGEPLVVYHGTKNEFYEFDTDKQLKGWLGKGFYFSKNKTEAKDYGKRLLKCFLNIKNPFVIQGDIVNNDGTISWGVGREGEIATKYGSVNPDDISSTLKKFGNDGIIEGDMLSCFYPNQIKLADGTNTTFSTMNQDIRYATGGNLKPYDANMDGDSADTMYKEGGAVGVETILFGVRIGEPDWKEVLITNNPAKIEDAKKWALANGFDRFRVSEIDMMKKPDFTKTFDDGGKMDKARYRIIDSNGRVKYTGGTEMGSWFNLDKAKKLVNRANGEMIYEYDYNGEQLWEVFEDGGDVDCYADGGATLSAEVFEWDKVPANYKNTSKVKKVPFINNPLDKGLDSIIAPFLGKDDLRPVMSGINFDENGITGTNAHILITLPYPNKKYEGVYDVNKAKKEKSDELLLIKENYPKYQNIIPKSEDAGIPYQVDVYKLLQYTKTAMNYSNKTTHAIAFKYGDDNSIGFNGKFLSIVLTSALKLGHEKIYVFIQTSSRGVVLSPNKNYELGNDELLITMPLMLMVGSGYNIDFYGTSDPDYNRSLKAYFDFNDSEIHNADGSVAEFKMQYENNLSVDDSYLSLLTKITRKNHTLSILNYAKVQNGKMTATDLDVSLIIKNVNMPDGIYEIVNKAPNITMNPIEDFPRERVFDKDEYTSRGNSDTRKNTSFQFVTFSEVFEFYLDKLLLSVGNDDLRPVMSGICIKKTSENQLFLISTNAHTLCKINITEYCEFNKDDRELEYILPVNYLKDFVKLADGSLHFKCSLANIFIEAENLEFIARAIDGNYPNYEAVIPKENNKKIVFDHAIMNKCLKSEKYTSLVAKYKDNKKVNYHIFNSGDKIFIKAYEMVGNQIQTIEDVEFCSVNIDYSETNKRITENDSLFLLMPVMTATTTPDRYFAFSKYYFDVMLKTITDTEVECYFTEPNRAYIFPIDAIDYKKTLPVEKTKQQKLSKADMKMIEEMETIQSESNELQEAIETLELLLETAKGKDKREIKEALEVLQMLNEK